MTLQEFENKIGDICSKNGWCIELDYIGIWEITVRDKDTEKFLGNTGATGLEGILGIFEIPFDECPWV